MQIGTKLNLSKSTVVLLGRNVSNQTLTLKVNCEKIIYIWKNFYHFASVVLSVISTYIQGGQKWWQAGYLGMSTAWVMG